MADTELSQTIKSVDENEWKAVVGNHVEGSHQLLEAVEDSNVKKMHYVFVREGETLVAAACSYPYTEKMYSVEMPLLEVKCPLGARGAFFYRDPQHVPLLISGLVEIQKKEKTKGILIFDLRSEEYDNVKNCLEGFTGLPAFEDTYIDLNFTDFEGYLRSLDGKARRSVRITLNRAKRLEVNHVFTNELSKWKETACRLQKHTRESHRDERMYVSEAFYADLERTLREHAELVLFFKDEVPIASVLALNTAASVYYTLPGVDPHYKECQAYFLLYYEGIKKAIERRQKRIYFGPTTYTFKEKIGCKKEPLYGFIKMENPLLNFLLASYIRMCWYFNKKF